MWNLNEWILLTILTLTNGYDKKCPHSSQWNFTTRSYGCLDKKVYLCLFDRLKSDGSKTVFTGSCGPEDLSREGFKYILTPDLYQVPCTANNYQPFTFTTNGNSQCVFSKSLCDDSGQILANNGSSSTDRSCRCDYTQNYDYVIPPKDPCSCKPAEEDCSCYIRKCDDDNVMIADYRCSKRVETILPEDIKCPIISRIVTGEETDTVDKIWLQDSAVTASCTWSNDASVVIIVIVFIFTVLIGFLFFSVPHLKDILLKSKLELSVKRKENEFVVLNEDRVTIECNVKSYLPVCSVTWQKERNGEMIQISSLKKKFEIVGGKEPSLTINHFNPDDEGKYRCIVRNVIGLRNETFGSCMNCMSRVGWLTRFVKVLQHIPAFHTEVITLRTYDISSQSKPTVCNVYKGDDITMEQCWDDQQKLQMVKWLKGSNKRIELDLTNEQYSGGVTDVPSLTIKKTTLEDAGKYSCILLFDNGESKMSSFKLKIIPQEEIYKTLVDHRKDKTFTRPAICDTIVKYMHENSIVVIIGREGTGKSKICLELASFYDEKDYMIMKVDLSETLTIYTDMVDTLLIIDDQQYTQDSLNVFMKHLLPVLHEKNIKVILTCRNLDLEILRRVPEINELKSKAFIDINNCLAAEEKEEILKKYMAVKNIEASPSKESNFRDPIILTDFTVQVKLDDNAIKLIRVEEPWIGFPLCASLFCSERQFLHLGEIYFTNPPRNLLDDMKELYNTAMKKSNSQDKKTEYCLLVYIMSNSNHQLDPNDHNLCSKLLELYITFFKFKNIPEKHGSNEDLKIAIEEALQRMNNKYLKFHEGIYEFIHPCLEKAMFLSSDSMVHYLLQNGSLINITEFVRNEDYTDLANELVIKITKNYHHILIERLVKSAFENRSLLQSVAHYIYTYWRSSGNEFVEKMFNHVDFVLFGSLGARCDNLQRIGNDSFSDSIKLEEVTFSNIIMLVNELTYKGRDPWIYGAGTADLIILSGLVTAAMGKYATDREQTFKVLLSEFQNRIHSKSFVKLLRKPLDIYRNTFFHYLMIFSQTEACQIFSLNKDVKSLFDVENGEKFTPLDIAAYLGKRSVLEVLDLKTNCTKNLRDRLQRLARSGNTEYNKGSSNDDKIDRAIIIKTTDDGVSPEKLQSEYVDGKNKEVIDESKRKKSKDKPNKTEKHHKIKCESVFIGILYFEDAMLNIVDVGKIEDYQACINLLSE